MKTGLKKSQKTTEIFFDEASRWIMVRTYNTDLKNRLTAYAKKQMCIRDSAQTINIGHLITDFCFGVLLDSPAAGIDVLDQISSGTAHRLHFKVRQDQLVVLCLSLIHISSSR